MPRGLLYYIRFTDKETEARGGEVTCQGSHNTEEDARITASMPIPLTLHYLSPILSGRSGPVSRPCPSTASPEDAVRKQGHVCRSCKLLFANPWPWCALRNMGILKALCEWAVLRMKGVNSYKKSEQLLAHGVWIRDAPLQSRKWPRHAEKPFVPSLETHSCFRRLGEPNNLCRNFYLFYWLRAHKYQYSSSSSFRK